MNTNTCIDFPSNDDDEFYTNPTYFSLSINDSNLPSDFTQGNDFQNYQNSPSPDISSNASFIDNYLFVQTPQFIQNSTENYAPSHKKQKPLWKMEKLGTCRKFSGYPRENGAKFLKEFESFATLHELDEDDEARKLAAFHLHLQGPALAWYNDLNPELDWDTVSNLFKEKYVDIGWQHPSMIVESETFQNMTLGTHQDIEDFYCQILEKGQILSKPAEEIMFKFINGLPEKLAFYVRSSKPIDMAEALSLAKTGEAYKNRVHGEHNVAAARAANDDISDLKRQMGELTNLLHKLSYDQQGQHAPNYMYNKFGAKQTQSQFGARPQVSSRSEIVCFNCNSPGHIKRLCNWNVQGNAHHTLECQLCNQKGHTALQCSKFNNNTTQHSNVVCQICSKFGHSASNCFQLQASPSVQTSKENLTPLKDARHDPSGK